MTKKEISSILSQASTAEVAVIAQPLKARYKTGIIKGPIKSLVMVQVRESIKRSLFYLGEVLVTECIVDMEGTSGASVVKGDCFDKALDMAIIDAAMNKQVEECEDITARLSALHEKQKKSRARRNGEILKSRVNFNVMGE